MLFSRRGRRIVLEDKKLGKGFLFNDTGSLISEGSNIHVIPSDSMLQEVVVFSIIQVKDNVTEVYNSTTNEHILLTSNSGIRSSITLVLNAFLSNKDKMNLRLVVDRGSFKQYLFVFKKGYTTESLLHYFNMYHKSLIIIN